jgi:hypothetical protein
MYKPLNVLIKAEFRRIKLGVKYPIYWGVDLTPDTYLHAVDLLKNKPGLIFSFVFTSEELPDYITMSGKFVEPLCLTGEPDDYDLSILVDDIFKPFLHCECIHIKELLNKN